jgi:hypothetical protein
VRVLSALLRLLPSSNARAASAADNPVEPSTSKEKQMLSAVGAVPGQTGMPPQGAAPPQMSGVSKLLGMSPAELSEQLRSGKTMSALASEKGVSDAELVKTIETELTANKPEGAPAPSASQLTQFATSIANGTPPPHHGSGGHGSHGTTAAQSLGVEPSALLEKLQGGSSLSALLEEESGYTSEGTAQETTSYTGIAFDGWA